MSFMNSSSFEDTGKVKHFVVNVLKAKFFWWHG